MSRPIITLTTDFGLSDSYVAQMKGVILSVSGDAQLVDVTHQISPQNIVQAALVVGEMYSRFPRGTVHVVVVDPGVGSARRPIAVEAAGQRFVAPDNGVLSEVLRRVTADCVVELIEQRFWLQSPSHTFHGRDVFAPVAAHLSLGVDLRELGPAYSQPLCALEIPEPARTREGWAGEVLAIDSFGNLVTNIEEGQLGEDPKRLKVHIRDREIARVSRFYAEVQAGELLALVGSSGRLEIAVREGSAAKALDCAVGEPVLVRFANTDTCSGERG